MSDKPSPEGAGREVDKPSLAAGSAHFDPDNAEEPDQPEAIRRANGGRDHRAFLAEMAADLEAWFFAQGMLDEAERHRQARVILETPVEPIFDADGVESLVAHDRIMVRYYTLMGNAAAAQLHLNYLAARGASMES